MHNKYLRNELGSIIFILFTVEDFVTYYHYIDSTGKNYLFG